jgi:hypothetical protein
LPEGAAANANATAIEQLSGWILALAGAAWIALFAFAPLIKHGTPQR